MVPIYENYQDYKPPRYARRTCEKLLSMLPQRYLSGLRSVVLTNASVIGKGKTQRLKGKKVFRKECLGFYHQKWNGEPPWIEIVVDNIVAAGGAPRWAMRIPIMRNLLFAETLFHEVGHHLEHTIGAPARNGEAAAEAWQKRLIGYYIHKRYWYLRPFRRIARALFGAAIRKRIAETKRHDRRPKKAAAAHA